MTAIENELIGSSAPTDKPPKVVVYYRIYTGLFCALYTLIVPVGAFLLTLPPTHAPARGLPPWITGLISLIFGVPLAAAYAVGAVGGRARWRHTYGIVLIAIGMTSMCCMPVTIPLLIFWLKPVTKSWFNE